MLTEIFSQARPSHAPSPGITTYSIVLAHPLTMVREGLASLCQAQPQYSVVDQCSDGSTAIV